MNPISNPDNTNVNKDIEALKHLAKQVENSTAKIREKKVTWLVDKQGNAPDWASRHLDLHEELHKAINEMVKSGEKDKIPEDILKTLDDSNEVVNDLASAVNRQYFLSIIRPEANTTEYADSNKILSSVKSDVLSPAYMKEWEINYGLLHSAYQRTDNEKTKAIIRFLMTNYLQKAAYFNASSGINMSLEDTESYQSMLQLGQMTMGGQYHRTSDTMNPTLQILKLEKDIGAEQEKAIDLIPTDTIEIQGLYNVGFVTTPDISNPDGVIDILVNQFEAHLDHFPESNMEFPVLIDITPQIGQSLITNGNPEKIKEYEDKQQAAKGQINEIIKQAAEKIKQKYPEREDIQTKSQDYMKTNTAIVSRAMITDRVGVIGLHKNIFDENDFEKKKAKKWDAPPNVERHAFIRDNVKEWAGHTAVGMGAVNFRQVAADSFTDPTELAAALGSGRAVTYAVPGKTDVIMYDKPDTILKSNLFKMLTKTGEGENNFGEGQTIMAKATAQMMNTLLSNITEEKWKEMQKDPIISELTQNALFRVSQHLATGIHNAADFRQFSQAIDRVHADLTTILTIYQPFDVKTFDTNYKQFIQPLFPEKMEPAQVGIAKSAMNVFAGVNAAVIQNNPNPVRICGAHSYYEESRVVGKTLTLDQALVDPSIEKVDMYVAEFYHNIDLDPDYTNYEKGTVIEDIRNIFQKKPIDSLTVAIDATLDAANSEDIKYLLQAFENEIKDGKLNIVVFRSGQKFDMMGLDNYFGSPFYTVNNGDKKWDEFSKIKTEQAFQTDPLSQQFFSWMAATGPEIVDQYKNQIFNNTREILKTVPEGLQPEEGREVCISTFDEGVKTPFIEITINLKDEDKKQELQKWAQQHFMQLFTADHKLVYVRGSFGFPNPNITWIDPKMRINPGVDPDDIRLFQQYFEDLEAKVNPGSTGGWLSSF